MTKLLPGTILSEEKVEGIKLDVKDKKILSALSVNARLTEKFLSDLIGLSKDTVRYRIRKLEGLDVIRGAALIVNPFVVGLRFYSVFLRVNNLESEEEFKVIKFLVEHPFTIWCGLVGGEWDIGIHIFSKDANHFNIILKEIKDKFGNNLVDFVSLENITLSKYENLPPRYRIENDLKIEVIKKDVSFQVFIKRPVASVEDKMFQLDRTDLLILGMLGQDPKVSIAEIDRNINVTFDTVKNRITGLIKNKIILAFNLLISITHLGLLAYILFVETRNLEEEKRFEEYLRQNPHVVYALKTQGRWDWQIYVSVYNQYEFYAVLRELRTAFSNNIRGYSTLAVVKDFKFNFMPSGIKDIFNKLAG
jgi:Lrp/AsnC family transcriptional regulator